MVAHVGNVIGHERTLHDGLAGQYGAGNQKAAATVIRILNTSPLSRFADKRESRKECINELNGTLCLGNVPRLQERIQGYFVQNALWA